MLRHMSAECRTNFLKQQEQRFLQGLSASHAHKSRAAEVDIVRRQSTQHTDSIDAAYAHTIICTLSKQIKTGSNDLQQVEEGKP